MGDDRLSLTVLGCSGSFPGPASPASGYLVREGATSVWLDAGSGTFGNLQRHIDVATLTAVVLTHSHVDHWVDLASLGTVRRWFRAARDVERPLDVYGTAETCALAEHLMHGDLRAVFDWHDITDGSTFTTGGLSFRTSRTDHPPETMGVRIDGSGGRTMVYSADTGPGWSPSALGGGVDLFLCEATMPVAEEGSYAHLSGRQAGALAREAGIPELVVTHVPPNRDPEEHRADAAAAFGAPVGLATVGATFDI